MQKTRIQLSNNQQDQIKMKHSFEDLEKERQEKLEELLNYN